jgi:hypothetical protein
MKRLIVVGMVVLAVVIAGAVWPVLTVSRLSRPHKDDAPYQQHGGGKDARADGEWRIAAGPSAMGLIVGAGVCGDEAFLLDRQAGRVHRVDLARRKMAGSIGLNVGALRFVTSVAADCSARLLYVTHQDGVAVFEADSGALTASYSKPATFVHTLGASVLDSSSQTLAVPGLWPQADSDWLVKPVDRMYEGDKIGYRLDLRSGRASPMLPPVERGCWSLGPNCTAATLDSVAGGGWVAAHRVGMMVGVYDARFQLIKTIDARSPLFQETGKRNLSQKIDTMLAWGEENSVIRQVHAFGDAIVTVHSLSRSKAGKRSATTFDVFMNVHSLDGVGLRSDVRLPDLPVGRDETALYVVDYGANGRRKLGRDAFSLVRIPVDQ